MQPRSMAGYIKSNPGPKPTLKTLLHTLTQSPTLTKHTNLPVQSSQSSPPLLSPAHSPSNSPTSVQSHLPPLQKTPTYHRASIQLHILIYLKQHIGPLYVSREGGVSASQVERTPVRTTLTYWVVGPLHSYTQEGWVDNNKDEKKKSWEEVYITATDLTHNSRRAGQTITKLSNDPTTPNHPCLVNANQVAH